METEGVGKEKGKKKRNGIEVRNEEKARDKIGRKKEFLSLEGKMFIIEREREREIVSPPLRIALASKQT